MSDKSLITKDLLIVVVPTPFFLDRAKHDLKQ